MSIFVAKLDVTVLADTHMKTVSITGGTLTSSTGAATRVLAHPATLAQKTAADGPVFHIHPDYKENASDVRYAVAQFMNAGDMYPASGDHMLKVFDLGSRRCVVKYFRTGLARRIVSRFFGTSYAGRAYTNAVALRKMDVDTPKPVAFVQHDGATWIKSSYYISIEHPSSSSLTELLCPNRHFEARTEALGQFTAFIHLLHLKGITFRRLEAGNVILHKKEDGTWSFSLVSTQNVMFRTPESVEERMQTFSRLTDRPEMLAVIAKEYALRSGEDPERLLQLLVRNVKKQRARKAWHSGFRRLLRLVPGA